MRPFFLLTISIFAWTLLQAQDKPYRVSEVTSIEKMATIDLREVSEDYEVRLQHLEMPGPGTKDEKAQLEALKKTLPEKIYRPTPETLLKNNQKLRNPEIMKGFEGNDFNGVPNDNDLAVSNDGIIISVTNSVILFYDEEGTELKRVSLANFAQPLEISGSKYDPRIVYDPEEDRFVMVFLNGFHSDNSAIILAFSAEADPLGEWHLYEIPGNPLNDFSWSDFPAIALTKEEFFLSINLLYNDSSWEEGFKQTIIWQIDKKQGYQGVADLDMRYIDQIAYNGGFLRNVFPVKGGSGLHEMPIYFLSNRNFDRENDTFFVLELNAKLRETADLKVKALQSDKAYGAPPNANQPGPRFTPVRKFQTNDARVLDGYLENGLLHFVGNSIHPETNRATVYHGKFRPESDESIVLDFMDHPFLEFGYPAIAFMGRSTEQDRFLLMFNHSSDTVFAGYSALFYEDGLYSDLKTVVEGETFVNVMAGEVERWGDYSGIQPVYNEPGRAWVCGYYGKSVPSNINLPGTNLNYTWIAQLVDEEVWTSRAEEAGENDRDASAQTKVFPNPTVDKFAVTFEMPKAALVDFHLVDAQGKTVKKLLQSRVKKGQNALFFNLSHLPSGIYFLNMFTEGELLEQKKVIKH